MGDDELEVIVDLIDCAVVGTLYLMARKQLVCSLKILPCCILIECVFQSKECAVYCIIDFRTSCALLSLCSWTRMTGRYRHMRSNPTGRGSSLIRSYSITFELRKGLLTLWWVNTIREKL